MKKKRGLFFLLSLLCIIDLSAKLTDDYYISYLTVEDGLTHNEVTSIVQDNYGFIWFGTRGGLNRYDGLSFRKYKPREGENSISNPSIETLFCDSIGNIWVGTKSGGVNCFNTYTESFANFSSFSDSLPKRIISFFEDFSGNIWIGGRPTGCLKYNPLNESFKYLWTDDRVNSIVQTMDSCLWFGNVSGLYVKKFGQDIIKYEINKPNYDVSKVIVDINGQYVWFAGWGINLFRIDLKDFSYREFVLPTAKQQVKTIIQDDEGRIWLGTYGEGLYIFNPGNSTFDKVVFEPKDLIGSIDFNVVLDIYKDVEGNIWLGTDGGGVVKFVKRQKFKYLNVAHEKTKHVNSVYEKDERLLIGTKGDGLYMSIGAGGFQKVKFEKNNYWYNKSGTVVKSIEEDPFDRIWISFDNALYILKEDDNRNNYLKRISDEFNNPALDRIWRVHDLHFNNDELWLGTQRDGLYLLKENNQKYSIVKSFQANKKTGLKDNRVTSIVGDSNDRIWVATYGGLFQFQSRDSTFLSLESLLVNDEVPACNIILCTHIDSNNNLWFGTPCSLHKLLEVDKNRYVIESYTVDSGIQDDYISSIESDTSGNLWIGSNSGITRLNPINGHIHNFNLADGIGQISFSESSSFMSNNGTIYFGGYSGLTYFNPSEIIIKSPQSRIAVTSFKVLNKEVLIENKGLLEHSINRTSKLTLTHKEKEFSFEFAALHYKAPTRNQYAYWLEGYNDSIVFIGNRHHVSFSNIKPGNYTLNLYGTDGNGIWDKDAFIIDIEILPAPWKTWYAYGLYIIIVILISYSISKVGIAQTNLKNKVEMTKTKLEQEQLLTKQRIDFFTNISHEIRTPLSLIMSPIRELMDREFTSISHDFYFDRMHLITKNVNRLYTLVNELLEFRRIEAGKVNLEVSKHNLKEFAQDISHSFRQLAKSQGTSYSEKFKGNNWECYIDEEKMRRTISNLLSNALKYCSRPGVVVFELNETQDAFIIKITNDGKGIAKSDQKYVFDIFYKSTGLEGFGNSGIGLALVKAYVELHKGEIGVESEVNGLTTFSFTLKKGKAHFHEEELILKGKERQNIDEVQLAFFESNKGRIVERRKKDNTILIVEDHVELRGYLNSFLAAYYNVIEAEDGYDAFNKAVEFKPELILSDVMMPKMDGYELCQKIKSNDMLSHIPVILLTAKGELTDHLFGTKRGADAFFTKPFNPDLLLEKIKQLIVNRQLLSQKFSQNVHIDSLNISYEGQIAKLMKKAHNVIENNLSNREFGAEQLADELGMSIATLYRKIKKLADKTPGDFIKHIRLQKAAQLLVNTNLSVSEIAENVGYQDVRYFRQSFKNEYNVSPLKYRQEQATN